MIEFLTNLVLWYNLIFIIPILFVIFYVILQIFGLAFDFGADVDMSAGEADIDVDSVASAFSALERALAFINVGKVPLTIIIATFMLFWGVTGFSSNEIIQDVLGSFPSVFILVSCAAAFVVGIIATKLVSGVVARLFPDVETYSSDNQSLLGQVAQVVSGQVTLKFGRAKIKDQYGNVLTVFCRISEGKEVPKRGDEIVLIDYDPSDNKFEVVKADFSELT